MKIEVGRITVEGFTKAFALQHGSILLRTADMLFLSRTEKAKILTDFRDFIHSLEAAGIEVEGKDKLKL
jgi:hypothetical protein